MNFVPQSEARTVELPVRVNNGTVELIYGGFPKLKADTFASLIVSAQAIEDRDFFDFVSTVRKIKLLDAGARLRVRLRCKNRTENGSSLIPASNVPLEKFDKTSPDTYFSEVIVNPQREEIKNQNKAQKETTGLEIRVRGMKPMSFEPCPIGTSCLKNPARSLNHAYTVLSENFETHRDSHTGNVFKLVYYYAGDRKTWLPLETLRSNAAADEETELQRLLWEKIRAAYLPWWGV